MHGAFGAANGSAAHGTRSPAELQVELETLVPQLYEALHEIAAAQLSRERAGHTLQATALAHEAYLRLSTQHQPPTHSRERLLAAAAVVMRRVLVDHARGRGAKKRGGDRLRVEFHEAHAGRSQDLDVLDLHEALETLTQLNPRQARVVELRYYGGLSGDEVASVLGVSPRTVDNDWRVARAWLASRLDGG